MDKIKVTIDGKELTAEKGQTILQIARDNNIKFIVGNRGEEQEI